MEVLNAFGLTAKYALGQNFLINDAVVQKILRLANVEPTDEVLEIGPGIGTLTSALLPRAHRVVAVEYDAELVAVLAQTLHLWADRFTLIEKDALHLQPDDLPFEPHLLVANLPYAVAASVLLSCFERLNTLASATVMLQKEVADRIQAKPNTKAYGAYTVKLGLYAQVTGHFFVAPSNFFPVPRIDSTVVRLDRYQVCDASGHPVSQAVLAASATLADAAFATRRKTLANSCKAYFKKQGAQGQRMIGKLPQLFERANIDATRRGETLTHQEFLQLGTVYCNL